MSSDGPSSNTPKSHILMPADIWRLVDIFLPFIDKLKLSIILSDYDERLKQDHPNTGALYKTILDTIHIIDEIFYLEASHPERVARHFQGDRLNRRHPTFNLDEANAALDAINSEIIEAQIFAQRSTKLDLSGAHITRIPEALLKRENLIGYWSMLTRLNCNYNHLTTLNVQGLVALKTLNCACNQLTTLNVQGLVVLETLDCGSNYLTSLNVQGLVALKTLSCHSNHNHLTTLNVQGCAALEFLNCGNNPLTALDLQGLTALRWLYCSKNLLTTLNLQELNVLEHLDCKNNHLITLNVQGLAKLKLLLCDNNHLTALDDAAKRVLGSRVDETLKSQTHAPDSLAPRRTFTPLQVAVSSSSSAGAAEPQMDGEEPSSLLKQCALG